MQTYYQSYLVAGERVGPFLSEAQEEFNQLREWEERLEKVCFYPYQMWWETEVRSEEGVTENGDIAPG